MKQERLKVLSLLEEGKISADEASLLLDKLNQADGRHFISDDTAEQVEEKLHRFAKTAEGFAKEFSQKAAEAYKDVEPKLKKASQAVLEKTASIVDDIAHSLHDTIENAKARAEQEGECCGGEDKDDDDNTPKPN
jgi:ElaB/YqjD/DUF883 family membrane-anchored ribosome-binding protein